MNPSDETQAAAMAGSALRRKLVRTAQPQPAEPWDVLCRDWRRGLARALRAAAGLPAEIGVVRCVRMSLGELLDEVPPGVFVVMLDGADEQIGVALLDADLADSLVEHLTRGGIAAVPPPRRRPTRTDAALICPLLDAASTELDPVLAQEPDLSCLCGFRAGSFLDDPRPLELMLEDLGYLVIDAAVGFAPVPAAADSPDYAAQSAVSEAPSVPRISEQPGRGGRLRLALPAPELRSAGGVGAGAGGVASRAQDVGPHAGGFTAQLSETVMRCPAELVGVLSRLRLPLHEALALAPGAVLEFPLCTLEQVRVETRDGQLLAQARLGQAAGFRALRLIQTPNDADRAAGTSPPPALRAAVSDPAAPAAFPAPVDPSAAPRGP